MACNHIIQTVHASAGAVAALAAASASSRCRTCSTRRCARRRSPLPSPSARAGVLIKELHFKPKAKRVIFLFMNGGVSHVDTFDPKPCSRSTTASRCRAAPILTQRKTGNLMKSPFKFKKHGKSGIEMSELWPNLGTVADDICVIRSMYVEIPNHEPSHHADEHRAPTCSAARRWARGSPTAWALRTRTFRASSCSRRPSR